MDENNIGILIAGATGHGLGPALLITQCRSMLLAICKSEDKLERTMSILNHLLCDHMPEGCFISCFFAFVNRSNHTFHYVSAGFPAFALYEAKDKKVHFLQATSMPLGVSKDTFLTDALPLHIEPEDIVVILTDGFSEWRNENREEFGEQGISQAIVQNSNLSSSDLIQAIYRQAQLFAKGAKQKDDLTAVAIKRTG